MSAGWRRVVASTIATAFAFTGVSVVLPIVPQVAYAATVTLTVTQGNYVEDPPLAPGPCQAAVGECSLRGALLEAQVMMQGGDDVVIEFAPGLDGVQFQEAPGGPGTANPAMYYVQVPAGRSLTIGGPQARPLLTGNDENRLFAFLGAGSVTLRNLDLENGRASNLPPGPNGGTIVVDNAAATLELYDVAISGSSAFGDGGSIYTSGSVALTERARAAEVPFDLVLALRVRQMIAGDADTAEIDAIHAQLGIVQAPRVVPDTSAQGCAAPDQAACRSSSIASPKLRKR